VKPGEQVVLTERGQPIAVIKPIRANRNQANAVREMVRARLLRPATRRGPMPHFRARVIRGRRISRTIGEERNAR
jgi:antitoxin (DNA-binding transcriptional repressor) of toxin-antitoxin stability system